LRTVWNILALIGFGSVLWFVITLAVFVRWYRRL